MDEKVDSALEVEQGINKERTNKKPEIPPRARQVSQLERVDNIEITLEPSSNNVYLVKKIRSNDCAEESLYYFKEYDDNENMHEIESYCGTICRFIATEEYVPSTRPYVNQKGEPVGVASKALLNFKSNYEDPLKEEDTVIDSSAIQIEQAQRKLILAVKKALDDYQKRPSTSSGYLGAVQSIFHSFYDSNSTSHKTLQTLKYFAAHMDRYSISTLDILLTALSGRLTYLETACTKGNEHRSLRPIQKLAVQLKDLYSINNPQAITVELLDKLDRAIKKEGIDLETCDLQIKRIIDGQECTATAKDLKNYRILKGQAISLTTRLIFKEGDNNNSNMSKRGQIIDFGWTKSNITSQLNQRNKFDRWIRQPSPRSFDFTPERMEYFPDAGDIY